MSPARTSEHAEAPSSDRVKDGVGARLFDADRTDQRLSLDEALRRRLKTSQLLWIDIDGGIDPKVADALSGRLRLDARIARVLSEPGTGPHLAIHGAHFHLRVMTEVAEDPSERPRWLEIVVAENIVITVHRDPVPFLQRMDERIKGDATVGLLDAPSFARSILDAAVTGYFEAVDAIEADVDQLDTRSLTARPDDDLLAGLVAVRRRIARLRRALSDHREVYSGLAGADFSKIAAGEDMTAGFAMVADRFEDAMHSVEDSRDLLLGSFDVYMTRMTQRTNDVMKVLALATVLLLPGSLIAGLLGMNVVVPLPKDDPVSFWIVVAAIALLSAFVLVVARRNGWIRWGRRG